MDQAQARAELDAAQREKEAMNAIVDPLRAERDALIAQIHPLEAKAEEVAAKIRGHMPRMAQIDRRLSAAAKALGHPRVGGLPELFRR